MASVTLRFRLVVEGRDLGAVQQAARTISEHAEPIAQSFCDTLYEAIVMEQEREGEDLTVGFYLEPDWAMHA